MSLKNPLCIALLMFCLGCSQDSKKNYVLKVKLHQLTPEDMYDEDLVYDVIFDGQEQDLDSLKTKSRQLFLQGVDLYKNKNNPFASISLFKQSIMVFPDAKTYYELGNALIDAKKGGKGYEEAILAYEVAEKLQFQPLSMIMYNKAVAQYQHSVLKDDKELLDGALYTLGQAISSGFSDTLFISKDKRIEGITNTPGYRTILTGLRMNSQSNKQLSFFDQFRGSFAAGAQPFEIPVDKVAMEDYKNSISYDFAEFVPEMENSEFGRSVSHDYFYVTRVAENPAYTALVYTSTSFEGEYMQPVLTRLVTYDNNGKIIASKLFSCQCSAEKVKMGKIEDNVITVEDYKRTWKKPIDEVSFDENEVDKFELIAKAKFRIDDSGNIVEESVPENYSDSSLLVLQPSK
jgi:tetratricopeptide (TPR) repeat protein